MERGPIPDFIYDFSKENDQMGRQETARQIKEKRNEHFRQKEFRKQNQKKISILENELAKLESSWFKKIFSKNKIDTARAELADLTSAEDQSQENGLSEAREILNGYYECQKKEWSEADYNAEDVPRYFSEDYLEKLSLEEYELLLSRFPGDFVTHVTRQGVRDHIGMSEHTAGEGEFSNGFVEILKDGRLRSVVEKFIGNEKREEALFEYFKWYVEQVRIHCPWTEDQSDFAILMSEIESMEAGRATKADQKEIVGIQGSYGDQLALHAGRDAVLDSYYGGESSNEIFFVYPVAHLITDHEFRDSYGGVDKNNNVWIWAKNQEGLSVNASIVFLPKETQVDKNTGSKYELDSENRPIVDQEKINYLGILFGREDFLDFLEKTSENARKEKKREIFQLDDIRTILIEEYKIETRDIQDIILNAVLSSKILYELTDRQYEEVPKPGDEWAKLILEDQSLFYKRAKDTTTSEQYWNDFFTKNPGLKPSKIVYYRGSPTAALEKWKYENKIKSYGKKRMSETYKGYIYGKEAEDQIREASTAKRDEYRDLCISIVEKYFPEGKSLQKA